MIAQFSGARLHPPVLPRRGYWAREGIIVVALYSTTPRLNRLCSGNDFIGMRPERGNYKTDKTVN